jgi:hypothetical protein
LGRKRIFQDLVEESIEELADEWLEVKKSKAVARLSVGGLWRADKASGRMGRFS